MKKMNKTIRTEKSFQWLEDLPMVGKKTKMSRHGTFQWLEDLPTIGKPGFRG